MDLKDFPRSVLMLDLKDSNCCTGCPPLNFSSLASFCLPNTSFSNEGGLAGSVKPPKFLKPSLDFSKKEGFERKELFLDLPKFVNTFFVLKVPKLFSVFLILEPFSSRGSGVFTASDSDVAIVGRSLGSGAIIGAGSKETRVAGNLLCNGEKAVSSKL